jgi:CHAD domain-containing protein
VLLPDEPFAAGLRRVILGQLDLAIELLESATEAPSDEGSGKSAAHTVHETRKAIKRLRALLRLMRTELGPKRFARENAALRDCGRRLARARDAEVMVGTLDALVQRHPKKLAGHRGVRELRTRLVAERERAAGSSPTAGGPPTAGGARSSGGPDLGGAPGPGRSGREGRPAGAEDLRAIRARVLAWELPDRGGGRRGPAKLLGPGLERIYREGRRGLRRAGRSPLRRTGDLELHAWRKRVKDLRYAAETLDRGDHGEAARRVRRVARRADHLGEILGEEHDLALLGRTISDRPELFAGGRAKRARRARKTLLKLIARRRKRLRRRALREGERLYRRKPRRFTRRLLAGL